VSFGLAFLVVVLLTLAGVLRGLGADLNVLQEILTGGEVRGSKRVRALFANLQNASDALEFEMAREDIQAFARARFVFAGQVSRRLGRAVSFLGAALGLIELATGTSQGEVKWTGVACLGLGAVGHIGVGWAGRDLARRAERAHQAAHADSLVRPQTF
jgi:hypothetical protein